MTGRSVPAGLEIDAESTANTIEKFIQREVSENGFERVVLGLSGGADSAVVAALCTRALGPDCVHAYMMPYKSSSGASRSDAEEVARSLGILPEVAEITPVADAYFEGRDLSRLRKGNVFARVRMLTIFDMAAARNALVAGTSNKTETFLGYSTWYGDSACSFQPIADLYKTQLWQLASWLRLPDCVISKAPSADLWPGQTDEEELGIEYVVADRILHALLDRAIRPADIIAQGEDAETVIKIINIIRKTQYKRQLPNMACVGSATAGLDALLASDFNTDTLL
jgi:NAD+ synthase